MSITVTDFITSASDGSSDSDRDIIFMFSLMLLIIVQNLDYLIVVLAFLSFIVSFCGAI